ncbi:MAG TPA: 23S rRNA (adenine(2503)-C(2))-methyltransferase RlmN [Rhabdochlamydiaceae bacterium]|nr:23S rRNA (adenine(2503)-C(2))-methyltransferase RlmN [Rhabdochlamydiaceae bacterium]
MKGLFGLTESEIKSWVVEKGEKPFRATQIFEWIYQKQALSWEEMTNLSKSFRDTLAQSFTLHALKLVRAVDSADGETTKFLWQLADGKLVESVLIYAPGRRTVCVSSQVGCPARCAFCASGKQGLKRNLSVEEIVEQVVLIDQQLHQKGERVCHVVFMGMGEPFENYENVLRAILLLNDPKGLNISQRKITVSTVGIVENIVRFADEGLQVNLALSLHAPNQRIRQKIIPYARKYALEDLLNAMLYFTKKTKRDITYEYTLLAGINDSKEQAQELARLLKGHPCTVNLIPYNPIDGIRLNRPEKEQIELFRHVLDEAKIPNTCRYTKGKDIAAACGQLALKEESPLNS